MNRFLSIISVSEAIQITSQIGKQLPLEVIPLHEAVGRILAKDIYSDVDIPGFDRSTVDGYAVISSETTGASDSIPSMLSLTGSIQMGETPLLSIKSGSCMYIPTGAFLPSGADAVVMIEYCESLGDQILVSRPVAPGDNVVSKGEDFPTGQVIVSSGTYVTSRVAGVLAACGASTISVAVRPRVGIISTGNELVPIDQVPSHGKIRDVNSYLCAGFVSEKGGIPVLYGIIPDDKESLEHALDQAVQSCDVVLISGGSSKGERDICADIIASRGEVFVHGIALSPGKPTIIGSVNGVPVIGLPGHPASSYVVLLVIVRILLESMNRGSRSSGTIMARLKSSVPSAQGREDYVRAKLEGEYVVPVFGKSGLTNTLLQSDGVIRIPSGVEGYEAGSLVEVILW